MANQATRRPHAAPRAPLIALLLLLGAFGGAWWFVQRQSGAPEGPWQAAVAKALEASQIEEARRLMDEVRPRLGDDPEWLSTRAFLEGTAGDYPTAMSFLQRHPQFGKDPNLSFMAGQLALQSRRMSEGSRFLAETLAANPRHVEALRRLGELEITLLQPHAARRRIAQLDQLGQATALDVCQYCMGDRARFDLTVNIEQFEAALATQAAAPLEVAALAVNYAATNRLSDARALLTDRLGQKTAPEGWRIPLGLAELAILDGDFATAGRWLADLPPESELLPRTWLARGRTARGQGDVAAAASAFLLAADLDPFDPEPAYVAAQLLKSSNPGESDRLLQRALKLQALNIQVEAAVRQETIETAIERLLQLAPLLRQVDANREAYLCLRWLEAEGYATTAVREELASLRALPEPLPVSLRAPDDDELRALIAARRPSEPAPDVAATPGDGPGATPVQFADITADSGLEFLYDCDENVQTTVLTSLGGGAAAWDFDRDAHTDLFFPQGGPLPNVADRSSDVDRLFRSRTDRFQDVTVPAGFVAGAFGHGAAVGDVNNDGFPDLYVANYGPNALWVNQGDGTFRESAGSLGLARDDWSSSAAFGDLDHDGDADLYVVNYLTIRVEDMKACTDDKTTPCGPMRLPACQDRLYENLGDGRFADVTESAGIVVPDGKGLGVVIADLDGDRLSDVFVGNDTTANRLFLHVPDSGSLEDGARLEFHEAAEAMAAAFGGDGAAEACMGIASGDVDDDGFLDLFVTNFEGETNTLYMSTGPAGFLDRTEGAGLARSSYSLMGWGAQFADFDADGDLDVALLNGHLHSRKMTAQVFLQGDGGRFEEVSSGAGDYFQQPRMGRGLALGDWNRDGRPDLVATDRKGPATLLRNDGRTGGVLSIALAGRTCSRDAVAARVIITRADGRRMHRTMVGGGGYLCANEPTLWFGLGGDPGPVHALVEWPDGRVDEFPELPVNSRLLIVQGAPGQPGRSLPLP